MPTGGDIQCPLPPGADSISAISWSPAQGVNHLAAASWDGYVRVWEIGRDPSNGAISQAATAGKAEQKVDGVSFLDCTWKEDGSHLFAVGTDNQVRMWNLQANTFNPIGSHAAPVRSCHWVKETQYLVTSGWDRQICVWDCRTNTPQGKISLNERVWACDVKYPWLVASTADKKVSIFNLASNPTTPYRTFDSPVAHQTRVVKIFHDQRTFAIGTIEGRVAVRYLDQAVSGSQANRCNKRQGRGGASPASASAPYRHSSFPSCSLFCLLCLLLQTDTAIEPGTKDKLKYSFSFRCHRQGQLIFPVNCIDAHPRSEFHDVFATAGSDGLFVFWNKTKKMKLKEYPHLLGKHTISSFAFNAPGDLCAYAASYEWSKGPDGYNTTQQPTSLMVHQLTNEDLNGTPSR